MIERRNINRGFKKLDVWKDAIELYVVTNNTLNGFPYMMKKISANSLDAAHSISRNIAEGYCRRSKKEYLNFLNFALGSSGEFHSCISSFLAAGQINTKEYERLDQIHYRLENRLIKLIKSIQNSHDQKWLDKF